MRLAYGYPPTVFILEAPPAPWIFSNLVPSRKPKTASSVGLELSSLEVVSTARVARKREYIGHFHGAMNVFTRRNGIGITPEFNVCKLYESGTQNRNSMSLQRTSQTNMKFSYQQIDLLVVPSRAGCCVSCTSFHRFNVEMVDRFSRRFLLYI